MTVDRDHWVRYLLDAVDQRREVVGITGQIDDLDLDSAYGIQEALVDARLADGDTIGGAKLGLTSKAKQEQMGVDEPAYGWVLGSSVLPAAAKVHLDELIHPRAEPELVFILGRDLEGSDVTAEDVLDATETVVGGIEVIDSRYEKFKFGLLDVVADNTSAARVAIGETGVGPRNVDLRAITCSFSVDGKEVASARGDALLGDPAECVAMLARHLATRGRGLKAGWVIPAGAPTDAHPLAPGTTVEARYSHLGTVTLEAV